MRKLLRHKTTTTMWEYAWDTDLGTMQIWNNMNGLPLYTSILNGTVKGRLPYISSDYIVVEDSTVLSFFLHEYKKAREDYLDLDP